MTPQESLKIGLAERVITPPMGVEMAGFAAREGVAEGVHDDLHARAMVIQSPESSVALLVASIIGFTQEAVDRIRAEVERQTDLPGSSIMVAATHTHSGPKTTDDYNAFLVDRCVECLVDAWSHREDSRLGTGTALADDVGRNRRRLDYGALPVDPEVGIVKIEDAAGKVKGVLLNYACHPTVLGPDNLQITEDWAYYAIRTVKERAGQDTIVIYANGAEGDINPGYSSGLSAVGAPIPIRTFPFAEKIGARLGRAVADALPDIQTQAQMPVRSISNRVDLPCRTSFPTTVEQAEARVKQAEETFERIKNDPEAPYTEKHRAEYTRFFARMFADRAREFYSGKWEKSISVDLQSIRLGDAALTSFPGEVFVEIGLEVKHRSPFAKTLVIGVANGRSGGYLPTRETYNEGDYEVVAAKYGEDAAEVLIDATAAQLAQLA